MRNFREEYGKVLRELPKFHMDVSEMKNEGFHEKLAAVRRRRWAACVSVAATAFLLFGVGTAVAVNFKSSRIAVEQNGFTFLGEGSVQAEDIREQEAAYAAADQGPGESKSSLCRKDSDEAVEIAEMEIEQRTYDTIEEFRNHEDVIIAIPELAWLGDPEKLKGESVIVRDEFPTCVWVTFEEKRFCMTQTDNRETPCYASCTSFMGEAANERSLTNDQGLTYKVFDSVEMGEITGTHAAISANGRDIIYSFFGYGKEEVDAVLKQLDVSIYFREE